MSYRLHLFNHKKVIQLNSLFVELKLLLNYSEAGGVEGAQPKVLSPWERVRERRRERRNPQEKSQLVPASRLEP
jgi:hypothetical protein